MSHSSASTLYDQLPVGFRMDQRQGAIYDNPPAGADDLTLVRGIDTREAVILNRMGIYFLAQIATWNPAQCSVVADEAGMSVSAMQQEQWVEQAQSLCRPVAASRSTMAPHLPASVVRTTGLLACAILVGCLLVRWMDTQSHAPMRGILSADITSLRVPVESRLLQVQVEAGQEVFSGDELLKLEKTEHLEMITLQQKRVHQLLQQLEKAEAQAELDLAWRTREVDRELSDVRTRAHLIQEVKRHDDEPLRSASLKGGRRDVPIRHDQHAAVMARPVSETRVVPRRRSRPNSYVFIAGASGESSGIPTRSAQHVPLPLPTAGTRLVLASEPGTDSPLGIEARSVEARLQRLEELKNSLPMQVRRAAGVEGIRVQYDEATQRLNEMKTLSREISVHCPSYGRIGLVRYKAGDTMAAGEIMLKILHSDRRFVILHVPSRRVNEVSPGMVVDLVFPGDEHFRGEISNLPMLTETAVPGGQSVVTVRVEPTGRLWPQIPVGSQIDVIVDGNQLL